MKKIISIIITLIIIVIISCFIFINKEDEEKLDKVTVAEVTHSAFYAPWYVAIEKGFFKENGIEIDVILTSGANNVVAAVLSNDVNIGLCGPEATIYVYKEGEKDYVQTFAGLTKRDGQFIVSRKKQDNFKISDLKGKEVLAGRIGGMPELNFENALRNSDIEIEEVNINTTIDFASLSGAFIGGTGDFVNLFEPNATSLEKLGYGYVVASIGKLSGEMPYTAFNARKSYINNNTDLIKRFTKSINEGLKFVEENDAKTIANIIINQFPDTSINDLITIINRYKENDSWLSTTTISKESFENLMNIMIKSGELDKYVPFEDLVINNNE
ncbi:MAG: ABC transporter substrate-binding protein [Bacilli bacterium]|nr:ABC transporter substrate-binding protein [Bacilli bacterium]